MNSALKLLKTTRPPVTPEIIKMRAGSAKNISMDWETSAPSYVFKCISAFTSAIGAPIEFLFFPLLSAVAAMMTCRTKVRLNEYWTEQPILWTIVAAAKGEKKSPALRILTNAVKTVEDRLVEEYEASHEPDGEDFRPPQIHMTNSQFTFAKLHTQMLENDGECFLMYDEVAMLYEQLEHQSGGSQCDKKILLSLNGGDSWSRSTKSSGCSTIENSHFNYTGFMQPAIAIAMLNQGDFDGFNDRHIAIVSPKHQKTYFRDLKAEQTDRIDLAELLYQIRKNHTQGREYFFGESGVTLFASFYDEMEDKVSEVDDNIRGIFSKAQGQLGRLSMVMHVLFTAILSMKENRNLEIDSEIPEETTKMAISVIRYCIAQKLSLMGEFEFSQEDNSVDHFIMRNVSAIRKFLMLGPTQMTASQIAQKKILPRNKEPEVPGGAIKPYPVSKVKSFLNGLQEIGAVSMIKEGKKEFFKRKEFEDLPSATQSSFEEHDISSDLFTQSTQ